MCLDPPKAPTPQPVAPLAPLAAPQPMGMADSASGRRAGGVSQLRIGGKSTTSAPAATPDMLGNGAAAKAGLLLQGRKSQLDQQIEAAGG